MSPRRTQPFLLALLVLLAVFVTACGGGPSKDDYEQGLARVQAKLEDANAASKRAAEVDVDDAAARSAALEDARVAIDAAADAADELDPPDDAAKAHAKLVKALRSYATLFGTLATLKDGDSRQSELYGQAGQIVEELDAANRALEKAGYEVPKQDGS